TPDEIQRLVNVPRKDQGGMIGLAVGVMILFGIPMLLVLAVGGLFVIVTTSGTKGQEKTNAMLTQMSDALAAYKRDQHQYPNVKSVDDLAKQLQPKYITQLPLQDGWNHPFLYKAWPDVPGGALQHYRLISMASDDHLDHEDQVYTDVNDFGL